MGYIIYHSRANLMLYSTKTKIIFEILNHKPGFLRAGHIHVCGGDFTFSSPPTSVSHKACYTCTCTLYMQRALKSKAGAIPLINAS